MYFFQIGTQIYFIIKKPIITMKLFTKKLVYGKLFPVKLIYSQINPHTNIATTSI